MRPMFATPLLALCLSAAAGDPFIALTRAYTKDYSFGALSDTVSFGQNVVTNTVGSTGVGTSAVVYKTVCSVNCASADDAIVMPSASVFGFGDGDVISGSSLIYPSSLPSSPGIPMLYIRLEDGLNGIPFHQSTGIDLFKGQNDAIVGFRLGKGDLARFGWIRLHRDLATVKPYPTQLSELATPFVPMEAVLNPFPGKPIRAGWPPELPVLQTSVLPDVGQGSQVRIRWPDGYTGVRLQRAASLESPVTWEEVDTSNNDVTLPAPVDGNVFYRLIYDF